MRLYETLGFLVIVIASCHSAERIPFFPPRQVAPRALRAKQCFSSHFKETEIRHRVITRRLPTMFDEILKSDTNLLHCLHGDGLVKAPPFYLQANSRKKAEDLQGFSQ